MLTDAINAAFEDPNRPRKDRYLSDEYLDRRIAEAREHIRKNKPSRQRNGSKYRFADETELVEAINTQFALVSLGRSVAYLRQRDDNFDLMNKQGCGDILAPYQLLREDAAPLAGFNVWLKSESRREYEAVIFDPENTDPRFFNMWRGLAVQPQPGSWPLFAQHLLDIVCGGNAEHLKWLIGWIAQMIQQPGRKPGTAVVLRGEKGTGKTTVAKWISAIFGSHAVTVDKREHLTRRFNSHLEGCVFLNAEEAFWAGDHDAEATLKNLITGDTMLLERKGVDAVTVANNLHLLVTSNARWTVPASPDERRFFVLDVTNDKKQDQEWFGKIANEFENGGLQAFLHDMLHFDYSEIDLRNPPRAPGLIEQIAIGLPPHVKWWHSALEQAAFESAREQGVSADCDGWADGPVEIPKQTIHQNFNEYVAGAKGRPWTPSNVGKFLASIVPGLDETRPADADGGRPRCYVLPALADLRKAFTEKFHVKFATESEREADNNFLRAGADMEGWLALCEISPRGPGELEFMEMEEWMASKRNG